MSTRRRVLAIAIALLVPLVPLATPAEASPQARPPLKSGEAYGIDVSSYQGQIAWPVVAKNGIAFAYIKATQGTTYVNPYFAEDWRGAKKSGFALGAYEFFSLCSSGLDQAREFLAVVPHDARALPPAIDLELKGNCAARPPAGTVGTQLEDFVTYVQRATGRKVVFYIGVDFANRYKLPILQTQPLWLRRDKPPSARAVVVWQPRGTFQINGIVGDVDLDVTRLSTLRRD